ncbi:2'-5' RNA ligase family protein [Lichenicoccus sp.]|uniref:2'-5' RNA ligase family protein n=1 Tax=Lichenicoccus sp. TaxID=2781899 RepID=UPI003D0CEDE7
MGGLSTQPTEPPYEAGGPASLLLTLSLSEPAQTTFQALRCRHFPADRNQVPAHVSLFHTLPGAEREAIVRTLAALDAERPAILVEAPRSLGAGVAFPLASPALHALRARLAAGWAPWLSRQDRQGYRPHVTVQNKVSREAAAATLARLESGFVAWQTEGVALRLWRYHGGPWEPLEQIPLGACLKTPAAGDPTRLSSAPLLTAQTAAALRCSESHAGRGPADRSHPAAGVLKQASSRCSKEPG